MLRFRWYTAFLLVLLTACSEMSPAEPTPLLLPSPTRAISPLPTRALSPLPTREASPLATPGLSAEAETTVQAAIADLAAKRKISSDKVQVVSVEAVDWPDTSLGCPQPGMFYAQVIVPGYRIVLSVEGQQVTYHTDRHGHVGTCPK